MFKVTYTTPDGVEWPLQAPESELKGAMLVKAGISGLHSQADDRAMPTLSPGQRFVGLNIHPLVGALSIDITDDPARDKSALDVWTSFRAGWSRSRPGVLTVTSPEGETRTLDVRLAGPLPDLDGDLDEENGWHQTISVPLVGDAGVWAGPEQSSSKSIVTVTNHGDTTIYPKLYWEGRGGSFILPSTTAIHIPAVSKPHWLYLDHADSLVVINGDGTIDAELWKQLRGQLTPEGVPPGATRRYHLSADMKLHWNEVFFDPWH